MTNCGAVELPTIGQLQYRVRCTLAGVAIAERGSNVSVAVQYRLAELAKLGIHPGQETVEPGESGPTAD